MTIDEAIAFCEEKVNNIKLKAEPQVFIQLAEWLEELKELREKAECARCVYNCGCIDEIAYKDGYNKAIDDFAEKFIYKAVCEGCSGCCNCYEGSRQNECEDYKAYMDIAEQLKVGVKDE